MTQYTTQVRAMELSQTVQKEQKLDICTVVRAQSGYLLVSNESIHLNTSHALRRQQCGQERSEN